MKVWRSTRLWLLCLASKRSWDLPLPQTCSLPCYLTFARSASHWFVLWNFPLNNQSHSTMWRHGCVREDALLFPSFFLFFCSINTTRRSAVVPSSRLTSQISSKSWSLRVLSAGLAWLCSTMRMLRGVSSSQRRYEVITCFAALSLSPSFVSLHLWGVDGAAALVSSGRETSNG